MKSKASLAIIAVLLFVAICLPILSATDVAHADFSYSRSFFDIDTEEDFYSFYEFALGGGYNFFGKTVRLHTDVDGSRLPLSSAIPMNGVFEGNGHTVYGLRTRIFSDILPSGRVENLELRNISVAGSALAYSNFGRVVNVTVTGRVSQGTVGGMGTVTSEAGGLLFINSGTVEGCTVACDVVSNVPSTFLAGIVAKNSGEVIRSSFLGSIVAYSYLNTVAGFSFENTGSFTDCVAAARFTFSAAEHGMQTLFATTKGGTVTDCTAIITDEFSLSTVETCDGTATATNIKAAINEFDGSDYTIKYYDEASEVTATDLDFSAEGEKLFDGHGTSAAPYIISDYGDLLGIAASAIFDNSVYALASEIALVSAETVVPLNGFVYSGGTLTGCGYAFIGGSKPVLDAGLSVDYADVGFVDCAGATPSGGYTDWNYGFCGNGSSTSVSVGELSGDGTENNPYRIDSAEALKALDGLTGFAVLTRDIAVNGGGNGKNVLGLDELDVELDGGGRTVVGLVDEKLCRTLNGKIRNLTLRGSGCSFASINLGEIVSSVNFGTGGSGIADDNRGLVKGCTVYGEFEYAFCSVNSGSIEGCLNYAAAEHVFTGGGTTENCITYTRSDDGNASGTTHSVDAFSGARYVDGQRKSGADYLTLKADGFDFDTVFGYPVGQSLPALRKYGVTYKTGTRVLTHDFGMQGDAYSPDEEYTLEELQEAITSNSTGVYENTSFSWEYSGAAFSGTVKNAGEYRVTASFAGSDLYLPATEYAVLNIKKAVCDIDPVFVGFSYDGKTYDGEAYEFTEPSISNASALSAAGFSVEYVLRREGATVVEAKDAGEYVCEAVFTSSNYYYDRSFTTAFEIGKRALNLKIKETSCFYGQEFDPNGCETELNGLATADSLKTLQSLSPDYATGFSTDYTVGANVGEYNITFVGTIKNYDYTIVGGKLIVKPTALPTDGISFYGEEHSVPYTGKEIVLVAEKPDGINVEYGNNSHKDHGTYFVTATFSKNDNYIPLTLTVRLTVEKIPLALTAPSYEKFYGETVSVAGKSVTASGLVEGETLADVGEISFAVYDGEDEIVGVYKVGEYDVKITPFEPTNYTLTYISGNYKIKKAPINTLRTGTGSVLFADGEKEYDGIAVERTVDFFTASEADIQYEIKKNGFIVEQILGAGEYTVKATVTPKGELGVNYAASDYACAYTIRKKVFTPSFAQAEYTFEYDGSDRTDRQNYPVSGFPAGAATEFSVTLNGEPAVILHSGDYTVSAKFAGTDNFAECQATATVKITPKPVSVELKDKYEYNGSDITPEVTVSETDEDLTGQFVFAYRSPSGTVYSVMRNAGDYNVQVTLTNKDFELRNRLFNVVVGKRSVPISVGTITYTYGDTDDVTVDGRVCKPTSNSVTVLGYVYEGISFNITLRLNRGSSLPAQSGEYKIKLEDIDETANYKFVPAEGGENVVIIGKRTLNVYWTLDGESLDSHSCELLYRGVSQESRLDYQLTNLAFEDYASDLELEPLAVSGDGDSLYDKGSYYVTLVLRDSVSYILSNDVLSVRILPEKLTIAIEDCTVQQWENYVFVYDCNGRVGEDKTKPVSELKGANVIPITQYTTFAAAGQSFELNARAEFFNYEVEITRKGTITVVQNQYPDYVALYWRDVTYPYSGESITVELKELPSEIRAIYSGNVKRNAGSSEAYVTIIYPTGRQSSGSCRFTILRAEPELVVEDAEMLFVEDYALQGSDIKGKAFFGDEELEGEFVPDGSILQNGSAAYSFTFIPRDSQNFMSVKGKINVRAATINLLSFDIEDADDFLLYADGRVEIYSEIKLTLKPVLTGLTLYRNGNSVSYIVLDKDETVEIKVMLGDKTAYSDTFDVKLIERQQAVTFGDESFDLTELNIKDGEIVVPDSGATLKLSEALSERYLMLVNGTQCEEFFVTGTEKEIIVIIKSRQTGATVYSRVYSVRTEEKAPEIKSSSTLYIIIGSCVGGVAVIVAVILIIWKKRHG